MEMQDHPHPQSPGYGHAMSRSDYQQNQQHRLPPGASELGQSTNTVARSSVEEQQAGRWSTSTGYPRSDASPGAGPTSETAHSSYGLIQGFGDRAYNDEREYNNNADEQHRQTAPMHLLHPQQQRDTTARAPNIEKVPSFNDAAVSYGAGDVDNKIVHHTTLHPSSSEKPNTTTISSILKGYATRHQLAYLIVVLVQTIATSVLIAIIWAKYRKGSPNEGTDRNEDLRRRSITVYLAIFLFGSAFEIITTLDALRLNNTIQLIGVCLFTFSMMIYAALLDGQVQNATDPQNGFSPDVYTSLRGLIWAMPIINGLAALVLAYLTWTLFKDFGWEILHLIGANRQLKKMYTRYQIFVCLLKFDFFFFVGFSLQYMILVLSVQEAEFAITIAAFPLTVIFLLLAAFAIRREIRWVTWIIFAIEVCGLAYFIFKFFRLFQASQSWRYAVSRRTLAVFSALAIFMLLLTFIYTAICFTNFGYGLRDNIPSYWQEHKGNQRKKQQMLARKNSGNANGMLDNRQSRMSID